MALLRELADAGRSEEAIRECDRLLADNALDAGLHFYRALILDQMGNGTECEKSLRRAIYLDRKLVLPHYHLGLFLWHKEDAKAAGRSFRNALTLLDQMSQTDLVVGGDDISVAQLRETVTMHLQLIGDS